MKQDKPHYEYILEEKGKIIISAPLIFGQCEERREIWRAPSWREARHRSRIIRPMEVYSMYEWYRLKSFTVLSTM